MKTDFEDRVVLVTGAARGLGLAYAKCLIKHGARVAMHDGGVNQNGHNPDPDLIANVVQSMETDRALPISGLLNSRHDCQKVVDKVIKAYGRIDGLIHNAGIVIWNDISEVDETSFKSSSCVNHEAAFWLCQHALPHMQKQKFGRLLLTSSGWALGPYPGSHRLTLYAQSKAAQFGLGMALANGTGHPDITINVLAPIANTRIYASDVPEGKLLPEAVAGTATWLVSPQCKINGRLFKVADGRISVLELAETETIDVGSEAANPDTCGTTITELLNKHD